MAMKFGSAKKNRCWMSGLPHGQPTYSIFGTVKTVLVCVKLTKNVHGVVCMRLVEMNGLSCMRISRLMHKLEVLT